MNLSDPARATATLRLLGLEDGDALLALQAAATRDLPDGFFRAKDAAALRGYLGGTLGAAYGILDGDTLRAAALLRVPDAAHPNPDVTPRFPLVPAADWPCHAAFLENAMVHPEARGRGHQRTLIDIRLAHAAVAGMRWAYAGSHLHNPASWSNLLARGLAIVGLVERDSRPAIGLLAGLGALRLVCDPRERRLVAARDPAQHRAALDDGFVGLRHEADGTVLYQRLARAAGPYGEYQSSAIPMPASMPTAKVAR